VRSILIDAGPMIALFDRDDLYHTTVLDFLKNYDGRLISTWPVITEAAHILDFNVQTQLDFFEWIELGGLTLFDIHPVHLKEISRLTKKYSDLPSDLADITLIIIAQEMNLREILTLDSDFMMYHTKNGGHFRRVLDSG
jgi:uncharacterized protein